MPAFTVHRLRATFAHFIALVLRTSSAFADVFIDGAAPINRPLPFTPALVEVGRRVAHTGTRARRATRTWHHAQLQ
jgi:hypothetical protein